jgi:hypothetical protein
MLAKPRKAQHVIDQPAHPLRLQDDAAHDLGEVFRIGESTLLVQLGVGAQ